jgi:hypothetical protein
MLGTPKALEADIEGVHYREAKPAGWQAGAGRDVAEKGKRNHG